MSVDPIDTAAVVRQLGRPARDVLDVAHRCPCGLPDVVTTAPRLADGSPFPTFYYLTCPRLRRAVSTLEGVGVMRGMEARLATEPPFASSMQRAHRSYIADRERVDTAEELHDVSAGGMPHRVKCLHAMLAHALARGPGVNPLGDEVLAMVTDLDRSNPCVDVPVRVAAIDCGTNSLRLLVCDVEPRTGTFRDVVRRMHVVRLGEGVDATGEFSPAALARTLDVLKSYARRISELHVRHVRFVATSAARDAANRSALVESVRGILGIPAEVVTGREEADLSFRGAIGRLPRHESTNLVVDIGGGSTELVHGSTSAQSAVSLDIGCVRLTERFFRDDPPTPAQVGQARDVIDSALAGARTRVSLREAQRVVGVAGTVTTVAGIALNLPAYDPHRIHGSIVEAADVHRIAEQLLYATHEERAAIPVMHPGRVDVIAAGALILSAVVAACDAPSIVASECDILDGIAMQLADDSA